MFGLDVYTKPEDGRPGGLPVHLRTYSPYGVICTWLSPNKLSCLCIII